MIMIKGDFLADPNRRDAIVLNGTIINQIVPNWDLQISIILLLCEHPNSQGIAF
jgi:hypothetical protein